MFNYRRVVLLLYDFIRLVYYYILLYIIHQGLRSHPASNIKHHQAMKLIIIDWLLIPLNAVGIERTT